MTSTSPSSTFIIDRMILFTRIWITHLGIGLPETGGVYLSTSILLDRIADAMITNLSNLTWGGVAATNSAAQGLIHCSTVENLSEIDKEVSILVAEQAEGVTATRETLDSVEFDLIQKRIVAKALVDAGQFEEAQSFQWATVREVNPKITSALKLLNGLTLHHAQSMALLNERLCALLAPLSQGCTPLSTVSVTDVESARTVRDAASILRVDTRSVTTVAAAGRVHQQWLKKPEMVTAAIGQRVGITHGQLTQYFNSELFNFESMRAHVIDAVRQAMQEYAAALERTAAGFDLTEEEVELLLSALDEV
ncbi:MAG: hypothetical protein K2Q25_06100 [Mycobacteriaceae bacterium]|nr:hypothetical protein [Mycobacteriaceae bacterium]